jgi:N-acetylmuramoyl-L-alanine amidase
MTPFDREIMARTLWMEARGEPREGIRAVAHVINNRVKSGRWKYKGKTSHALVCLGDRQFSAWNADSADANREAMAVLDDDDAVLQLCRGVVDMVAAGDDDPTFGATHYYNADLAQPAWGRTAELTVKIGHHRFYRGVA